jgi:hypothetical protein
MLHTTKDSKTAIPINNQTEEVEYEFIPEARDKVLSSVLELPYSETRIILKMAETVKIFTRAFVRIKGILP